MISLVTAPPSARPFDSFINRTDQAADRLVVALTDLLGCLRFGLDRAVDDALELRGSRPGRAPRAPRSRRGRRPLRPAWPAPACPRRGRWSFPRPGRPAPPRTRVSPCSRGDRPHRRTGAARRPIPPVTQLATAFAGALVAGRQGALEVLAVPLVEREGGRRLLIEADLVHVALATVRGEFGERLPGLLQHGLGGHHRHQVGLGEVAVVVRVLLRAQAGERAVARVEVERLLARPPPRSRAARAAEPAPPRCARPRNRKLFMFLSSVLTPSSSEAAGRIETFPSTRRLPCSRFTS